MFVLLHQFGMMKTPFEKDNIHRKPCLVSPFRAGYARALYPRAVQEESVGSSLTCLGERARLGLPEREIG